MSYKLTRTENALCFLGACAITGIMLLVADYIVAESMQDMANAVAFREAVRERTIHQKPVDDLLAELNRNLCQNENMETK